jgi:hypothetical protein
MAYNPNVTSETLGIARGRLQTACQRAWRLSQALEALVPHRAVNPDDVASRTRVTPAPPWHARAALLVMDLHALTRDHERVFVAAVTGREKVRGGSDRNTELSLEALPRLAEALPDSEVWRSVFRLEQWVHKAEEILGLIEPLRHLPTLPGDSEPRCPWCGYLTLRWQLQTARIHCVNPGCAVDEYHDRRPAGYMEMDFNTGTTDIVWDDELPEKRRDLSDEGLVI